MCSVFLTAAFEKCLFWLLQHCIFWLCVECFYIAAFENILGCVFLHCSFWKHWMLRFSALQLLKTFVCCVFLHCSSWKHCTVYCVFLHCSFWKLFMLRFSALQLLKTLYCILRFSTLQLLKTFHVAFFCIAAFENIVYCVFLHCCFWKHFILRRPVHCCFWKRCALLFSTLQFLKNICVAFLYAAAFLLLFSDQTV